MFPVFWLGGGDNCVLNHTISSDQVNWNLLTNMACVPTAAVTVNITVNGGVVCRGTMDLSGLPTGSIINLTNNGAIIGYGGAGGRGCALWADEAGSCGTFKTYSGGAAGGAAISLGASVITINITNASGSIWGGGGGGGAGGSASNGYYINAGGGGGGGAGAGAAAGGLPGNWQGVEATRAGTAGATGATYPSTGGGAGGTGAAGFTGTDGDGGAGGDYGVAGTSGNAPTTNTCTCAATSGGAGGYAVAGASATINFVSGGTSPNVEGAVG